MTAGGDAHVRHLETGAARARAPGRGGDGIAADRALAAEDTVTATSTAPDTSKHLTPQARVTETFGLCDKQCRSSLHLHNRGGGVLNL